MQSLGNRHDISKISLGDRRGQSDLARFSLDLTWARADSESAARSKGYPSPPMSGSPPLPPKGNQDSAAERTRGSYQATTQDAHRGISATQMDAQTHRAGSVRGVPGGSFAGESQERFPYGFRHPEPATDLPQAYHQQQGQPMQQQQGQTMHPQLSYLPPPGPGGVGTSAAPPGYPLAVTTSSTTSRQPTEQQEGPPQSSPKLQRKTKGHVASACVPCKRAHLRQVLSPKHAKACSHLHRWHVLHRAVC